MHYLITLGQNPIAIPVGNSAQMASEYPLPNQSRPIEGMGISHLLCTVSHTRGAYRNVVNPLEYDGILETDQLKQEILLPEAVRP